MSTEPRLNDHGQPIGPALDGWVAPVVPDPTPLVGDHVELLPWDAQHAAGLADAFEGAPETLWTYLPYGPFDQAAQFVDLLDTFNSFPDWQVYTVTVDPAAVPRAPAHGIVGFVCLLRIDPPQGSIEVGGVTFSPHLQRTRASTEAQYLLMRHSFDLGFRRYEWKCDSLNGPSRTTAARLGFTFEGIFRNATVYKGRGRDTAWFSVTDDEWPAVRAGFERWLSDTNFDQRGVQARSLQECRVEA